MSAWVLGREAQPSFTVEDAPAGETLLTYVGRVLKWIPADVVALFTAATKALVDDPNDAAGRVLIFGGVVFAGLFVIGGAWSQRQPNQAFSQWLTAKARRRAVIAPVAFLIWSPTVPDSGWDTVAWVAENPGWTVVACAAAGALFALIVDGLED